MVQVIERICGIEIKTALRHTDINVIINSITVENGCTKKTIFLLLTLTSGTIEKEVIDRFVYQIVQQSDDHFLWFLNLQPGKKQTLIAKVKGRKGKGVVELTSGDESMSNNPVFNLENKKDDPKEVETSLESSIYTYKSIDFNQFIVKCKDTHSHILLDTN